MDTKQIRNRRNRRRYHRQRWIAASLIVCLMLTNLSFESILAYATEGRTVKFHVGESVTVFCGGVPGSERAGAFPCEPNSFIFSAATARIALLDFCMRSK